MEKRDLYTSGRGGEGDHRMLDRGLTIGIKSDNVLVGFGAMSDGIAD